MNRPRVMEMGVVVVLAGALVSGSALAQSPTPPAGERAARPDGARHDAPPPDVAASRRMPHGPMMPSGARRPPAGRPCRARTPSAPSRRSSGSSRRTRRPTGARWTSSGCVST